MVFVLSLLLLDVFAKALSHAYENGAVDHECICVCAHAQCSILMRDDTDFLTP